MLYNCQLDIGPRRTKKDECKQRKIIETNLNLKEKLDWGPVKTKGETFYDRT